MLKRMETIWDSVFTLENVASDVLEKGSEGIILRQNISDSQVVQCAMYSPQNLIQKLTQLRIMLRGRCKSLKLYYDVNSPSNHVFAALGFERTEKNSWCYSHAEYNVTAIISPSFSDSKVVIEISSRKGVGIPSTACNIATLFELQMSKNVGVSIA
jgi:hypothetical protein